MATVPNTYSTEPYYARYLYGPPGKAKVHGGVYKNTKEGHDWRCGTMTAESEGRLEWEHQRVLVTDFDWPLRG